MNTVSSEKRKYEQRVRAERHEETRQRIVAAIAALHAEIGPARTTVAEIARRAGVQRLTVYAHFPDDEQMIMACQEHFYALQPPPDMSAVLALAEPGARLRGVLSLLYAWYRQTEAALAPMFRDRGTVPAVDRVMRREVDAPHAELATVLAVGFAAKGERGDQVRALVRLALDFGTWARLAGEGLDDAAAAETMTESVTALAGGDGWPARHAHHPPYVPRL